MQPRVKFGLIVGLIGLIVNLCMSSLICGLCGPVVAIIVGLCAGYFAAQAENASTKSDGAKVGATAGGIAGAIVLIGQLIGGVSGLILTQAMGISLFGANNPLAPRGVDQTTMWLISGGTWCCFGLVDVVLSAGAGALLGYIVTRGTPAPGVAA